MSGKHHRRGFHSRKPLMRRGETGILKQEYLLVSQWQYYISESFQPTRRGPSASCRVPSGMVRGGRVQRSDNVQIFRWGALYWRPCLFSVTITTPDEEVLCYPHPDNPGFWIFDLSWDERMSSFPREAGKFPLGLTSIPTLFSEYSTISPLDCA
ncbi:hypothetical protein OH76DRAFT_361081 [Lentinus brumalis]|uniref:Uncharacterized protein n=1 Tax=Lentinus brumalis TaxID=2498619 RepID=A0A371CJ65_9APHY|nr:hypothetical protein OH76DRAFT_361081 [Polyporus brumalis]